MITISVCFAFNLFQYFRTWACNIYIHNNWMFNVYHRMLVSILRFRKKKWFAIQKMWHKNKNAASNLISTVCNMIKRLSQFEIRNEIEKKINEFVYIKCTSNPTARKLWIFFCYICIYHIDTGSSDHLVHLIFNNKYHNSNAMLFYK